MSWRQGRLGRGRRRKADSGVDATSGGDIQMKDYQQNEPIPDGMSIDEIETVQQPTGRSSFGHHRPGATFPRSPTDWSPQSTPPPAAEQPTAPPRLRNSVISTGMQELLDAHERSSISGRSERSQSHGPGGSMSPGSGSPGPQAQGRKRKPDTMFIPQDFGKRPRPGM